MDLNEITTETGMREFTSNQRDTLVNDAREIRQIAGIVRNRIAETAIEGDKPGSARRRAAKIDRKFGQVARHLEKAAALCEAIDATHRREVLELPARRTKALEKKQQRRQVRALTRQKAHTLTQHTLAESAQHLAVDPRTDYPQTPTAAPQPVYNTPHPHAYAAPQGNTAPLQDFSAAFTGAFEETG